MPLNLQAKYRSHMTPDERALVHIVDALLARGRAAIDRQESAIASQQVAVAQERSAIGELGELRNILVKRTQMRMRYREKLAVTDRRTK